MKEETKIAILQNDVNYIKTKVDELNQKMDTMYITRIEFEPIKRIAYGMVALILIGVLTAGMAVIVK